jgi:hypothetical protein
LRSALLTRFSFDHSTNQNPFDQFNDIPYRSWFIDTVSDDTMNIRSLMDVDEAATPTAKKVTELVMNRLKVQNSVSLFAFTSKIFCYNIGGMQYAHSGIGGLRFELSSQGTEASVGARGLAAIFTGVRVSIRLPEGYLSEKNEIELGLGPRQFSSLKLFPSTGVVIFR